jgi:hypothetical protein
VSSVPPRPDAPDWVPPRGPTWEQAHPGLSIIGRVLTALGIGLGIFLFVYFVLGIIGFGYLDEASHGGRGFVWNAGVVHFFNVALPLICLAIGGVVAAVMGRGTSRRYRPLIVSLLLVLVMLIVVLFASGHFADCRTTPIPCGWPT